MSKTFYLVIFLFFSVLTFSGLQKEAGAADEWYINPVSFTVTSSGQETFSFPVSKAGKYSLFSLDGGKPRLVIDFPDGVYTGKRNETFPDSKFVTAIRSAIHQQPQKKTRIVIDLKTGREVSHQDSFDAEKKILTLVLSGNGEAALPSFQPKSGKESSEALSAGESAAKKEGLVREKELAENKKEPAGQEETQPELPPEISSITFTAHKPGEERVLFHLNGFYPPKISTKEDDIPQVICDFADARLLEKVEKQIITGGNLVRRITARQLDDTSRVQVVLEFSEDKSFDLQQVFFKDRNLFGLIVREFSGTPAEERKEKK